MVKSKIPWKYFAKVSEPTAVPGQQTHAMCRLCPPGHYIRTRFRTGVSYSGLYYHLRAVHGINKDHDSSPEQSVNRVVPRTPNQPRAGIIARYTYRKLRSVSTQTEPVYAPPTEPFDPRHPRNQQDYSRGHQHGRELAEMGATCYSNLAHVTSFYYELGHRIGMMQTLQEAGRAVPELPQGVPKLEAARAIRF